MNILIPFATLICFIPSCTPQTVKIMEDVIEGEEQVVEKVISDEIAPSPQVRPVVSTK